MIFRCESMGRIFEKHPSKLKGKKGTRNRAWLGEDSVLLSSVKSKPSGAKGGAWATGREVWGQEEGLNSFGQGSASTQRRNVEGLGW
jgi:hypothetical protein